MMREPGVFDYERRIVDSLGGNKVRVWEEDGSERQKEGTHCDCRVFDDNHQEVFAPEDSSLDFDCLRSVAQRSMSTRIKHYSGKATVQNMNPRRAFAQQAAKMGDKGLLDLSQAARVEGHWDRFFLTDGCAAQGWSGTRSERVCLALNH